MKRLWWYVLAASLIALAAPAAGWGQNMAQPPSQFPRMSIPPASAAPGQIPGSVTTPSTPPRFILPYGYYYNPWGYYNNTGQYWYAYYPTPTSSSPVVVRYYYGPGYAYYYYYVPPGTYAATRGLPSYGGY